MSFSSMSHMAIMQVLVLQEDLTIPLMVSAIALHSYVLKEGSLD